MISPIHCLIGRWRCLSHFKVNHTLLAPNPKVKCLHLVSSFVSPSPQRWIPSCVGCAVGGTTTINSCRATAATTTTTLSVSSPLSPTCPKTAGNAPSVWQRYVKKRLGLLFFFFFPPRHEIHLHFDFLRSARSRRKLSALSRPHASTLCRVLGKWRTPSKRIISTCLFM